MSELKLIYGCLGNRASRMTVERIAELVKEERPCICIVPEQQTVIYEAKMAEALPPSAPLCFEVTNFSRLADSVFRRFGGISYNYAGDTARTLIMWRTLVELSPMISEFSHTDSGSLTAALDAMADMHARGLTPGILEQAADRLEDSSLKNKLRDLAMISTLSKAMLKEKYDDSYDDLDRMSELLTKHRPFEGYEIFLDGFVSLTAGEHRALRALLTADCKVTVGLPIPQKGRTAPQFTEGMRFENELRLLAADTGAEVTEETAPSANVPPLAAYIAEHLTDDAAEAWQGEPGGVRLIQAEDPIRASEFIACDIAERVRAGASYSDFAVIVRDTAKYEGITDRIFARHSIPCFISAKTDLTSLEPVKLIRTAYRIISGSWRQEDVIAFLKCGLSGISREAGDEFEDYCAKWHISGSRFTDGIAWNMNPDGYTAKRTEYGNGLLLRVNETRERLCELILPFSEGALGAKTVLDHARALYNFLADLSLPEKLDIRAAQREAEGDRVSADEYGRLWKLICDSLDTLCDILGDVEADPDSFTRLLDIVFGDASLGRIPTHYDQVIIGAAHMIRVDDPRHVYILGANKDEFPAAVNDSGLFGNSERQLLRSIGLDMGEDVSFLSAREQFFFYRALLFASEGVDVIHTRFGGMRAPTRIPEELERLVSLSGDALERIDAEAMPPEFYIVTKEAAADRLQSHVDDHVGEALRRILEADERLRRITAASAPLSVGELSLERETAARLFGGRLSLTQSRITAFTECPFKHFGQYVLKLDPSEEAEINYRDIGNYIHRLLEVFFGQLAEEGRHLRDIPPEELPQIAARITDEYIKDICPDGRARTARLVRLFERLSRNALVILRELREEFAASDFDPALFEAGLDDSESSPQPLTVELEGGGEARVYGTIDRVDRYEKDGDVYIRVVDYKNGSHKFQSSNIASGADLQLMIYLMSVTSTDKAAFRRLLGCARDGRLIPAGAVFFTAGETDRTVPSPAKAKDGADQARKAIKRSGILLDDEGILTAMDGASVGRFIPLKKKKEGGHEPVAGSLLLSMDGMAGLFSDVSAVIAGIGAEMRSGNINTAGHTKQVNGHERQKKRCADCPMKLLCRNPIK